MTTPDGNYELFKKKSQLFVGFHFICLNNFKKISAQKINFFI